MEAYELPEDVLVAYAGIGVIINKAITEGGKHILYISVPSSSYLQNAQGVQLAGSVIAEKVKQHLSMKPGKLPIEVKYKIRQEHWTEAKKWRAETRMLLAIKQKKR